MRRRIFTLALAALPIFAGITIAGVKIARADINGACIYNATIAPIAGYPALPACTLARQTQTQVYGSNTGFPIGSGLNGDAYANSTNVSLQMVGFNYGFNGTSWDRTRNATDLGQVGISATARNSVGPTAPIACDKSFAFDQAISTTAQLIAASGSTVIYICGYELTATAATTAVLEYGTGTNCATGTQNITGSLQIATAPVAYGGGLGTVLRTTASQALCMISGSGGNGVHGFITYAQF